MTGLIPFVPNIPFATHNPSSDQPNMLINTNSEQAIWGVDHVSFNTNFGGTHNKVTFTNAQIDPGLSANQAQIYPKTFGTSGATYLETFTASKSSAGNQVNGYLPFVKCIGRFTGSPGPYPIVLAVPTDTLYVNIANITQTSATSVTVTFTTALAYTTYFVFFDAQTLLSGLTTITKNTGNFVISSSGGFNAGVTVGLMVI